jgi:hypothetical protein
MNDAFLRFLHVAAAAGALSGLGACGTTNFFGGAATPSQPAAAPDMRGRWTLSSPGRGACGMNFAGAPGGSEGTIAPEGGCPGNFFTSRRWVLSPEGLEIRDHKGEPLARLAAGAGARFDGQATSGEPVSLAR